MPLEVCREHKCHTCVITAHWRGSYLGDRIAWLESRSKVVALALWEPQGAEGWLSAFHSPYSLQTFSTPYSPLAFSWVTLSSLTLTLPLPEEMRQAPLTNLVLYFFSLCKKNVELTLPLCSLLSFILQTLGHLPIISLDSAPWQPPHCSPMMSVLSVTIQKTSSVFTWCFWDLRSSSILASMCIHTTLVVSSHQLTHIWVKGGQVLLMTLCRQSVLLPFLWGELRVDLLGYITTMRTIIQLFFY